MLELVEYQNLDITPAKPRAACRNAENETNPDPGDAEFSAPDPGLRWYSHVTCEQGRPVHGPITRHSNNALDIDWVWRTHPECAAIATHRWLTNMILRSMAPRGGNLTNNVIHVTI